MSIETILDKTKEIIESLSKISNKGVFVGIPHDSSRTDSDGISNAQIAFINEFGSDHKNIPARPFLNPAIEKNKDKISQIFKDGAVDAMEGKDSRAMYDKAGLFAQSAVKNQIVSQEGFKPLNLKTIKARQDRRAHTTAGTKALIDTGQMLNSITYIVKGV